MEFLAGVDLEAMMHARRRPPLAARVDMVMQLCAGLSYAHQQGVVHRDIKPSNVRVLDDGTIKLIDFGIAKVSRSGPTFPDLAGSVAYTSPEQLHGAGVDARSDVFSVGVLMYELFGGRPPFVGDSPTAIAYQVLNHDPSPVATIDADVPEVLSDVVARALEKSPERRYEDAAALAEALAAAASEVPSHGLDQPFGEGRSSDLLLRSRAAQSDGYANVGLSGDSVKTPRLRLAGRGEKIHEMVCRCGGRVPIREVCRARSTTATIRTDLGVSGTLGTCGASNASNETRRS